MIKSEYSKEIAQKLSEERICTAQGFCYKKEDFDWSNGNSDEIIYVPEYGFEKSDGDYNGITPDIGSCYTKNDFINICNGNEEEAEELFDEVDWQFPETLYNEWDIEE